MVCTNTILLIQIKGRILLISIRARADKKHKEKVTLITEKVKSNKKLVAQLFVLLKTGNDAEKGFERWWDKYSKRKEGAIGRSYASLVNH